MPPKDTVISLCPAKDQFAPSGVCTGITAEALRINDDGVSVTWVEYFSEPPAALEQAALELKKTRKPSATGVLACASVGRLLEVTAKLKLAASVQHTPINGNDAHSSILGCPNTLQVRMALARAFHEFIPNKSVSGFYP